MYLYFSTLQARENGEEEKENGKNGKTSGEEPRIMLSNHISPIGVDGYQTNFVECE